MVGALDLRALLPRLFQRGLVLVVARQIYPEHRALADDAVAEDEAAGLLDDTIDSRKTEARALADVLGREERLPYLVEDILGNSGTGILHFAQHILARRHRELARLLGGNTGIRRAYRQGTTIRHRIARIDGEIDDDLLELVDIDLHHADVAAMHDLELDLLAEQPSKEIAEVRDDVGQRQ